MSDNPDSVPVESFSETIMHLYLPTYMDRFNKGLVRVNGKSVSVDAEEMAEALEPGWNTIDVSGVIQNHD